MKRLSRYLLKLFTADALALFSVALVLVFLLQCLKIFDLVSAKGQNVLVLLSQTLLAMPQLALVFLSVCIAIGLGRALAGLQQSRELHIIHASGGVPALFTAIGGYMVLGTLAVLVLAHLVEPVTNANLKRITAEIAADLVNRTLQPHRFVEVTPGVMLLIGGRQGSGEIRDFFADDKRNSSARRTYIAKSAIIAQDDKGYVLQLNNGSIQYMSENGSFSSVAFTRYDVALDGLVGPPEVRTGTSGRTTIDLVSDALASGEWSEEVIWRIASRTAEGVRVLSVCLLVMALAAFPSGRRGATVPIEFIALAAAFLERGLAGYIPLWSGIRPFSGSLVLFAVGLLVLAYRLSGDTLPFALPRRPGKLVPA